jgi:hypothetical protein
MEAGSYTTYILSTLLGRPLGAFSFVELQFLSSASVPYASALLLLFFSIFLVLIGFFYLFDVFDLPSYSSSMAPAYDRSKFFLLLAFHLIMSNL